MKNKIILGAFLSGFLLFNVNAQEKAVKVSDGNEKTEKTMKATSVKKSSDVDVKQKDANVNFEKTVNPNTMGQDQIIRETLKLDGMVVGDKRQSAPLIIKEARVVSIEFKSDNPNALFYLVDRLENVIIPATEKAFNDKLPAGEYFLMVGLTPEAVKNQEKATYEFLIQ